MKTSLIEFSRKARLVKKSDSYEVYDLALEDLILSMTVLHRDKSTTGHSHDDTEEIYLFIEGKGEIELNRRGEKVLNGDIVMVPRNVFHRVFNTGDDDLIFLSFFEKCQYRGK